MKLRTFASRACALVLSVAAGSVAAEQSGAYTSLGRYRLGATTLPAIERELGAVSTVHTGDAGETLYTICYRVGGTTILFMSGELDGPKRSLGGFRMTTVVDRPPCKKWPATMAAPNLALGGLRLGHTRAHVRSRLGIEAEEKDDTLFRTFTSKRRMTPAEIKRMPLDAQRQFATGELKPEFDRVVAVTVRFVKDSAREVIVWKSETW